MTKSPLLLVAPAIARRLRSGFAAVAATVLCAGCASLSPPPPVDILPTTPPPLAAASRTPPPITGGLFHTASYRPGFEDRRARLVGDSVTIQIVENVTASQKSSSTVDRNSE
ncbi:MAG: flagellar basal body L-ring protein FlgH, partial [Gammaproteobacteria bacterium]|nr:flagellar basal body L-ring protein FlgH [Gammaproteobacteria bacterium]